MPRTDLTRNCVRGARARGAVLVALAGAMLILLGWAIGHVLPADDVLGPMAFGLLEAGGLLMLLAVFPARGFRPRGFAGLGLLIVVSVVCLTVGEVVFRWARWDFRGQEAAWRRLPPFSREPRTPTGTVFFRRDGPEAWTGAVIRASLELRGRPVPAVYRDEPGIVARYDEFGFRNDERLKDWELAIAGDSFTELGFLAFDQLFTSILARELGLRVRNLGVSGTGPYTQLHYLREFGDSPSLAQVMIVFFEGNDLEDIGCELEAMSRFQVSGERPSRDIVRQSSMLTAVAEAWRAGFGRLNDPGEILPVHTFLSAGGGIPVHLTEVLPHQRHLPADVVARLDRFFTAYGTWARDRGVEAWLAYMPCKARVLHSRVRLEDRRRQGREPWWPEELPWLVADACLRHGIVWVDLTPALVGVVRDEGELVFNPLFEVHLNAKGSRIVAEELVQRFRARAGAAGSPLR